MNIKLKVIRDSIHGEIKIFPLEWLIIDTPVFQRLRFISQLSGSQYVFPNCTHNRFSHSLGVMNITHLYSNKFLQEKKINYFEYRILRLASLLHDIAHGPFSHQFDDTIYKKYNYINGHDDFRKKVILHYLPLFIKEKLQKLQTIQLQNIIEDLKYTLSINNLSIRSIEETIWKILGKVVEVFEEKDNYKFSIVQGPLGGDRLDFIWRDSYFSGIKGFSKGDIERIISNSSIIDQKLVYHIKAIDEIFSALYGRFMLYKNLYFHKTARAVDLMIQKILNLYSEIIDFSQYLENPFNFIKLTDDLILNLYKEHKENNLIKEIEKLINNIRSRTIWKMIDQKYIYDKKEIETLRKEIEKKYNRKVIVDITEELNIYGLSKGNIFLYNEDRIIDLKEFIKENPIYNIKQPNVRILRFYIET